MTRIHTESPHQIGTFSGSLTLMKMTDSSFHCFQKINYSLTPALPKTVSEGLGHWKLLKLMSEVEGLQLLNIQARRGNN
ncbi:hypothetical protein CEXT_96731 [Caerostris extrusa]|uniref:Uncharacterized protein n=1 Tax=Caerostris extrusa TaxID=172846 RepID=A0AAV4ULJ5_CAEEX|nr:hypothetical protein CEXT_96731 [Caerostris extrusa]